MKTVSVLVLLLLSSGIAYGGGYNEAGAYWVNGVKSEPREQQQPAPSNRRQQPTQSQPTHAQKSQQQPAHTQGLTFYNMEPTKTLADAAINVNLRHANKVAGWVAGAAAIGAGLSEAGGITQATGTAVNVLSGTSSGLSTAPVDPPTPSVP